METSCVRFGCTNTFNVEPQTRTLRFFCSKECRLLGRGSKRGKRIVKRMNKLKPRTSELRNMRLLRKTNRVTKA